MVDEHFGINIVEFMVSFLRLLCASWYLTADRLRGLYLLRTHLEVLSKIL